MTDIRRERVALRKAVCDEALHKGANDLHYVPSGQSQLLPTTPAVKAMVSGGGWRAMESAAHFYDALAHYGLTAVTSEVQGLSGGSWGTAMVCMTGEHNRFHGPENQVRHSQEAAGKVDLIRVPTHLQHIFDKDYANAARDAVHTGDATWTRAFRASVFYRGAQFGVDGDIERDTAWTLVSQSQTMWETYSQILKNQLFGTPVLENGKIMFRKPTSTPDLHQVLKDTHDQPVGLLAAVHVGTTTYTESYYGFDGLPHTDDAGLNTASNVTGVSSGGLRRITNGDQDSEGVQGLSAAARTGERVPLSVLHAHADQRRYSQGGHCQAPDGNVSLDAPAILAVCGSAWMTSAITRTPTTTFSIRSAIDKPEHDFGLLVDAGNPINLPIPFVTSKSQTAKGRTDIVLVCEASGGARGAENFALARQHGAFQTDMDPKTFDAAVNKPLPEDTVRVIFPKEGSGHPVFIVSHGDVSPTGTMAIYRTPEVLAAHRTKIFGRIKVLKHAVQQVLNLNDWPAQNNLVMDVTATTTIPVRQPLAFCSVMGDGVPGEAPDSSPAPSADEHEEVDPIFLLVAGEKRVASDLGVPVPFLRRLAIARLTNPKVNDDTTRAIMKKTAKIEESQDLEVEAKARFVQVARLLDDASYLCFVIAAALYDHTVGMMNPPAASSDELHTFVDGLPDLDASVAEVLKLDDVFAGDGAIDAASLLAPAENAIDALPNAENENGAKLSPQRLLVAFIAVYCVAQLADSDSDAGAGLQLPKLAIASAMAQVIKKVVARCSLPSAVAEKIVTALMEEFQPAA